MPGVSIDTLKRWRNRATFDSFEATWASRKPLLNINHVRNRLRWGNEHLNMDVNQWKRWTFSDESTVELDCSEGVKRYIINRNQRLEPEFY